jgi:hypothetical protein
MEEVKARITCINTAALGKTGLPAPIAKEFCYLQIRFLCELVALACLVAHGDIAGLQSHKIGRAWSADQILKKMSQLRPHFYPIAIQRDELPRPISGQPINHNVKAVKPSPLDRDQLLALYGDAHKYIHRGSLKKLLSSKFPLDPEFNIPEVIAKAQPISDLLGHHLIAISENKVMVCLLNSLDYNNAAQVVFAGRPLHDGQMTSILTL